MRRDRAPLRCRRAPGVLAAILLAVALATGAGFAGSGANEDEIFRQLKVDVFDGNWAAVLRGAETLLARAPEEPVAAQAAYYRARALAHLPGRKADAASAYREFVARHASENLLVEQAWSGIFSLACDPRQKDSPPCVSTLSEGLASPLPYVSTLAAIRASDTHDAGLRRRALAELKSTLKTQPEADVRNEILIAILKIDPREVPVPNPPTPQPGARAAAPAASIRLTIYNKAERRYDVKVVFPVAFAQMLVDALGEEERDDLRAEARKQGVDLDDIFAAIRKAGPGRFLDVDTEESRLEVWIE